MTRKFVRTAGYYLFVPDLPNSLGAFNIRTIRVSRVSAGDRWLQPHVSNRSTDSSLPSNGAVPLWEPLFLPANYISEDTYPDGRMTGQGGVIFVVSSTHATLTIDATAVDGITVEIEEFELQGINDSVGGDYTTSRTNLQVWAEAGSKSRLLKLEMSNSSGGLIYAQVHAKDSPAEGTVPLLSIPIDAGSLKVLNFGNDAGFVPYRQDADGTAHRGCTVVFSSTQNTKTIVLANSGTIRATYKTV